jgi:hypothetical protein
MRVLGKLLRIWMYLRSMQNKCIITRKYRDKSGYGGDWRCQKLFQGDSVESWQDLHGKK